MVTCIYQYVSNGLCTYWGPKWWPSYPYYRWPVYCTHGISLDTWSRWCGHKVEHVIQAPRSCSPKWQINLVNCRNEWIKMSKRTNERKRTNKWTNEQTNEWMSKWTTRWVNKWTVEYTVRRAGKKRWMDGSARESQSSRETWVNR